MLRYLEYGGDEEQRQHEKYQTAEEYLQIEFSDGCSVSPLHKVSTCTNNEMQKKFILKKLFRYEFEIKFVRTTNCGGVLLFHSPRNLYAPCNAKYPCK